MNCSMHYPKTQPQIKEKKHNSSSNAAVKRWDDDENGSYITFQSSYIDPFKMQASDKLVNFASGNVATDEVQASMNGAVAAVSSSLVMSRIFA